jgi:hypothetical protein
MEETRITCFTAKMEAARSFETLVPVSQKRVILTSVGVVAVLPRTLDPSTLTHL